MMHQISVVISCCAKNLRPHWWARRNKSMKRIGLKLSTTLTVALLVVLAMAHPARTLAQARGEHSRPRHQRCRHSGQQGRSAADHRPDLDAKGTQIPVHVSARPERRLQGHGNHAGKLHRLRLPERQSMDFIDNVAFTNGRRQGRELRYDARRVHREDVAGGQEGARRIQEEKCRDRGRQCKDPEPECLADAGAGRQQSRQIRRGDNRNAAGDRGQA